MIKNKKKRPEVKGKNVRIPINEFNIIKKYVDENKYKLGGFFTAAALEKIENDTKQKLNIIR